MHGLKKIREDLKDIGTTVDDEMDKTKLNNKIENKRTRLTLTLLEKSRLQLKPKKKEGNTLNA